MASASNFYTVIRDAVRDFTIHGFDSQMRLEHWLGLIERAATAAMMSPDEMRRRIADHLRQIFERTVGKPTRLLKMHPGVSAFRLQQIAPRLRAELDRRIMANVSLITLGGAAARQKALQRFAGWATSIPAGGSRAVDKVETAEQVRRSIAGLAYRDRFAIVDQGHKLVAAIHNIVAVDGGAIALVWHHVKEGPPAYDARPKHVARDGKIYVLRGNWAIEKGLIRLDGHQYYDEVTAASEEPGCRCWVEYIYALRDLPEGMLTAAGKAELERVRAVLRSA